jgi:hypothetical protein
MIEEDDDDIADVVFAADVNIDDVVVKDGSEV